MSDDRPNWDTRGVTKYWCLRCWRTHHKERGDIFVKHINHALTLPDELEEPLAAATMQRQMTRGELVKHYVEKGLIRDDIEIHPKSEDTDTAREMEHNKDTTAR